MPYIKSIPIKSTPNRSLAYIVDKNKTDDLLFVSGLNCSVVPTIAYQEMKLVFEEYSKHKFNEAASKNEKTPVKAIHYVQSFRPTDNITPEQAHAIALEWAEKAFGSERQILVSTHINKEHIHSHIIINTYDFNGKKFNDNKTTLNAVRNLSDTLCMNYGIQPINTNKKSHSMKYNEWENKKKGTSWKQQIRIAIDKFVLQVNSIDELISKLQQSGFAVKRGKYLSIKASGQQRFVRTKTLGEDYTEENISERIRIAVNDSKIASQPKRDINELNSIYYNRIYDVSKLIKQNMKVPKKYDRKQPYSIQNDYTIYTLANQLSIINREHISSIGELEGKLKSTEEIYKSTKNELNKLISNQEQFQTVLEHCKNYFILKNKDELSAADMVKLKIYEKTVQRVNVKHKSDIDKIQNLINSTNQKIQILSSDFHKIENQYKVYQEIVNTYYKISNSDYISQLITDEKKKHEKEKRY